MIDRQHSNHIIPALPASASPAAILEAGLATVAGPIKLACSFSVEDVVVIDLIRELQLPIGIFALDTGRLNEETYEVAEAVVERYGVSIDWYFPEREAVEKLERGNPQGGAPRPGTCRPCRLGHRHAPGAKRNPCRHFPPRDRRRPRRHPEDQSSRLLDGSSGVGLC